MPIDYGLLAKRGLISPDAAAQYGLSSGQLMSDEIPDPVMPGQQYAMDITRRGPWIEPGAPRGGSAEPGGSSSRVQSLSQNPANANKSQAEIKAELPPPLSRMDRDWQNYGRFMQPDDVLKSEVVWGAARLGAEQGLGRAESFANAANDLWRRMGANRYITPEIARRHMAVEEARMRDIGAASQKSSNDANRY